MKLKVPVFGATIISICILLKELGRQLKPYKAKRKKKLQGRQLSRLIQKKKKFPFVQRGMKNLTGKSTPQIIMREKRFQNCNVVIKVFLEEGHSDLWFKLIGEKKGE
ncbi:hypothetical protein BDC45DRAFT_537755 [Circinella umbellata]|nr:hypothetical protein BDC45DRAFT_537755 [Circinella umbellata]